MTMWTMILMMVITIIANPLAVCTWWSRDPLGLKMLQLDFRLWPFWETRLLLVGVIHHHPHHHHPKDWSTIGRHHHHPEDFDIIILLNIIVIVIIVVNDIAIIINKTTLWRQLVCKISSFFDNSSKIMMTSRSVVVSLAFLYNFWVCLFPMKMTFMNTPIFIISSIHWCCKSFQNDCNWFSKVFKGDS